MKPTPTFLHTIVRVACAMCFIGHGAFGFITKPVWCNYFAVFGIDKPLAYTLMPVVGAMDILLGLILIFYPLRFAAAWLVFWGIFTALLRPLSGESFAEFLERAGNFGAPVIFLLLSASADKLQWFKRLVPLSTLDSGRIATIQKCLQVFGFLLLVGHGWLNLIGKPGLLAQYQSIGFSDPMAIARIVGLLECMGAILILTRPIPAVVLLILIWKMASETLYPNYTLVEWVERGGSYAVLLALWVITNRYSSTKSVSLNTSGNHQLI